MKIITAVESFQKDNNKIYCFLGGGITKCWNWQKEVIEELKRYDLNNYGKLDDLVILNPRRDNFPINDPNASFEQINWEFWSISDSDIFSMYFAGNTDSPQPICFYELGRFLGYGNLNNLVLTVEDDFIRKDDVKIQTQLVADMSSYIVNINNNVEQHVFSIIMKYFEIQEDRLATAFES